jgi:D-alanyl-lipoteichoic acid acyltransferase DltB (MBOAT superfamily)
MLFPTVTFAGFFAIVYLVHTGLRARPLAWKLAMLAASYVFYGWWSWSLTGLLAASTLFNWGAAALIERGSGRWRTAVAALAITGDLALLGLFKYYDFFVEVVSSGSGSAVALPAIELVLPIGISFYTFQALSYVVEVLRGRIAARSLLDVGLYLAFFPQLVAGPIVRATEFLPQLDRHHQHDEVEVTEAAWLIARGLAKKVVVATYLAESVVDPVFAAPSVASRAELLQAFYGYAIQIYADFSGYTDMAIGIALLLGFRFPVNFDSPYRSLSIQEFWRRWHMTLSRWLRDYLYISLGGNRSGRWGTYRNLMLTMVLGGLWHGAAWTFVVWGALHGGALAIHRLAAERAERRRATLEAAAGGDGVDRGMAADDGAASHGVDGRRRLMMSTTLRWFVTFHLVCLAWIPFRSPTFGHAWDFVVGLATAPLQGPVNLVAVALIMAALAAQLVPPGLGQRLYLLYARTDPTFQSAALGVWVFLMASLGPEGVAPFIYFQF